MEQPHSSTSIGDGQKFEVFADGGLIEWERAQKRMLLYLRSLNVAPDRFLMLAGQAYRLAQTRAKSGGNPVSEVMISLWEILKEHNIMPASGIDFNARVWRNWAYRFSGDLPRHSGLPDGLPMSAVAEPPIHRRPMPAATLQYARRPRGLTHSPTRADGRSSGNWFYFAGVFITVLFILIFGL